MGFILIADDDPLLTGLVEHQLVARGYRVQVAGDGDEALRSMEAEAPDLVVLDAMMPRVDGAEVLRRMRDDRALACIPVIMLTARKLERDIVGAFELGAADYVTKPVKIDELVARISRLLSRP